MFNEKEMTWRVTLLLDQCRTLFRMFGRMFGFRERGIDMEWPEFEERCEELVRRCLPNDKYRIISQYSRVFSDGERRRMDFHIAERKQGGKHYVVDCKHFTKAYLNENEIRTTLNYKRKCRASKAIILVSKSSNCPQSFINSAQRQGVLVLKVSTTNSVIVNRMKDFFFEIDLS